MNAIPLWDCPHDWNPNVAEGRAARAAGKPMNSPYGDSAAGKDWNQGWRSEDAISTVPIRVSAPPMPAPVVAHEVAVTIDTVSVKEPIGRVVVVSNGRRGRPPATGRFATRAELEEAVLARKSDDPKQIAQAVGVSFPTVVKILANA